MVVQGWDTTWYNKTPIREGLHLQWTTFLWLTTGFTQRMMLFTWQNLTNGGWWTPQFFFALQGGSKIDEKELTLRRLATGGTSHDECVQTGVWDVASMGSPNYNEGRPNNYGHMISLWGERCQLLLPTSVWHSCDQLAKAILSSSHWAIRHFNFRRTIGKKCA